MLTFHVVTLFPEALGSYLQESIIGRAIKEKKIAVKFYNPRDFVAPKLSRKLLAGKKDWFYRQTDDRPYGGGPGMVLMAEPILKAIGSIKKKLKADSRKLKAIIFSPAGKQFTNQVAATWAKRLTDVVLICGRYEGVDARVKKILRAEEISVGPYVLTGGELPALIAMDTTARQIEGVLGTFESVEERRISTSEVYTRPEVLVYNDHRYRVPKVLLSGHRAKIEEWKAKKINKIIK